jgi:acyl-CoA reductase-like NAD-dependent aldehyde dehydrogenase
MATVATRNGAFIGGEWVAGDGEEIEIRSPGSGEVVGSVVGST